MAEPVSAAVLQAVAHPLRLALLVALDAADRPAGDLAATLDVSPGELAPHIDHLQQVGLVAAGATAGELTVTTHGWTEIAERLKSLQDGSATASDG